MRLPDQVIIFINGSSKQNFFKLHLNTVRTDWGIELNWTQLNRTMNKVTCSEAHYFLKISKTK